MDNVVVSILKANPRTRGQKAVLCVMDRVADVVARLQHPVGVRGMARKRRVALAGVLLCLAARLDDLRNARLEEERRRYEKRHRHPKSSEWFSHVLWNKSPAQFRRALRMSPSDFEALHALLSPEEHAANFPEPGSGKEPLPKGQRTWRNPAADPGNVGGRPPLTVRLCLAVFLYTAGHGIPAGVSADLFGISPSAVLDCKSSRIRSAVLVVSRADGWVVPLFVVAGMKKMAVAVFSALHHEISWYTPDELVQREEEFAARQDLRGCIGAVDGTLIPISVTAELNDGSYYCRKRTSDCARAPLPPHLAGPALLFLLTLSVCLSFVWCCVAEYHAIAVQAVCDARGLFRQVTSWVPGSRHDQFVFMSSPLPAHLDALLYGFYIVGDSGYVLHRALITPLGELPGTHEVRGAS